MKSNKVFAALVVSVLLLGVAVSIKQTRDGIRTNKRHKNTQADGKTKSRS